MPRSIKEQIEWERAVRASRRRWATESSIERQSDREENERRFVRKCRRNAARKGF